MTYWQPRVECHPVCQIELLHVLVACAVSSKQEVKSKILCSFAALKMLPIYEDEPLIVFSTFTLRLKLLCKIFSGITHYRILHQVCSKSKLKEETITTYFVCLIFCKNSVRKGSPWLWNLLKKIRCFNKNWNFDLIIRSTLKLSLWLRFHSPE